MDAAAAEVEHIHKGESFSVRIIPHAECRDLSLSLKRVDVKSSFISAIRTCTCGDLPKHPFLFIFFEFKVDGFLVVAIIEPGQLRLIALFIVDLNLIYSICGKVACGDLGIIAEELLAIHIYFVHFLSLRAYGPVFIHFYAGKFFEHVFHIGVGRCFECAGMVFNGIIFHGYWRGFGFHHDLGKGFELVTHGNCTEVCIVLGFGDVYISDSVVIVEVCEQQAVFTLGNACKRELTFVV